MFGSTESIKKIIESEKLDFGEETKDIIEDISEEFPTAIKAEKRGKDILILRNINPLKRFDGKMARYSLEYQWLDDVNDTTSVRGNDYSYWLKKELNWKESLFDQVSLF